MLLLCLEKSVQKVLLVLAELRVLYAFHKTLDRKASGDREVIELVKRTRPFRVLSKPFVERRDLANLTGISMYYNAVS